LSLTAERDTRRLAEGHIFSYPVKAATKIYAGALVALNGGVAQGGAAATTLHAVGRAEETVDNSGGSDGDAQIKVRRGIFCFDNSTSTDAITMSQVGTACYIVDDHTVAKTDGSSARSVAGTVRFVDAAGVWVEI
jgi:hypothetical protein